MGDSHEKHEETRKEAGEGRATDEHGFTQPGVAGTNEDGERGVARGLE
jgi:hypothetical protein